MTRTRSLFSILESIALATLLAGASPVEAQLVQVGPGYVKAPFVRVYRTPHGTVVRAPFTHVESGTPAYGRQFRHEPYGSFYAVPQGNSFDQADDAEVSLTERQRRLVGTSARRLDYDLRRFRSASPLREVLQLPPEILQANPRTGNAEPVQPEPEQPDLESVVAALNNFDAVAGDVRYRKFAQLKSFRTTHRLLREYVLLLSLPREEPSPAEPAAQDQPVPAEPEAQGQPLLRFPSTVEPTAEEIPLPFADAPQ